MVGVDLLFLTFAIVNQLLDGAVLDGLAFFALIVVLVAGLGTTGILIGNRQPGNAVGWIFLTSAVGRTAEPIR